MIDTEYISSMTVMVDNEYINNMANLLNGELRGSINSKARSENLSLISLTLNSVFEHALEIGIKEGVNNTRSEILKDEITERVKDSLNKDS